jgi:hypothetical protein
MAWYWQVIMAVVVLNVDLVLAVLLGSVLWAMLRAGRNEQAVQ